MRSWGWLVLVLGLVWLAVAFNMETSVETHSSFGPSRVENIGLIANRSNHLLVASLITLIGALMCIFGRQKDNPPNITHKELAQESLKKWPCERDLQLDQYRLWLAAEYKISRNDLFDQYVLDDHLYKTLDEALVAADLKEVEKRTKIEEAASREVYNSAKDDRTDNSVAGLFVWLIAIAVLVVAPFTYYGLSSGANNSGRVSLEKSFGFAPPESLSLVHQETVSSDNSLTSLCGGGEGRLFAFETKDTPLSIIKSLDVILGAGKEPMSQTGQYETESRVYAVPNGQTLHVWASSSGKVYFCSTTGS